MIGIELGENHRRSIAITLQTVDRVLCEWEDWTEGKLRAGVMYRQCDTYSPKQKEELRIKISRMRDVMKKVRDDLGLAIRTVDTSRSMLGGCGILWEMLTELNGRGLQKSGSVPEGLSHYLDPIGEELAAEMNAIAKLFSRPME